MLHRNFCNQQFNGVRNYRSVCVTCMASHRLPCTYFKILQFCHSFILSWPVSFSLMFHCWTRRTWGLNITRLWYPNRGRVCWVIRDGYIEVLTVRCRSVGKGRRLLEVTAQIPPSKFLHIIMLFFTQVKLVKTQRVHPCFIIFVAGPHIDPGGPVTTSRNFFYACTLFSFRKWKKGLQFLSPTFIGPEMLGACSSESQGWAALIPLTFQYFHPCFTPSLVKNRFPIMAILWDSHVTKRGRTAD